jgi:hypothetical protein
MKDDIQWAFKISVMHSIVFSSLTVLFFLRAAHFFLAAWRQLFLVWSASFAVAQPPTVRQR